MKDTSCEQVKFLQWHTYIVDIGLVMKDTSCEQLKFLQWHTDIVDIGLVMKDTSCEQLKFLQWHTDIVDIGLVMKDTSCEQLKQDRFNKIVIPNNKFQMASGQGSHWLIESPTIFSSMCSPPYQISVNSIFKHIHTTSINTVITIFYSLF